MNANGAPAFSGFSAFGASAAAPPNWGASTSTAITTPFTPAAASVMKKQPSNQISTLEVFGEDSDSRKKRFETALADNRYMELKPLREAQRLRDIASGLIPDPLKPRRLDEATDFLGTCEDMCPEWEREEREYQNNVDHLERYPGTTRIDPRRAVKAFHRPAAGNDQPLPSDVRPPRVLKTTLDYLFRDLMPTKAFGETHPFLRDRTRAVRQDFTMQNERGTVAIECNERIARYHVLALGVLREQSSFSESQELEQLRKVLKSLNEFYDDARLASPPIPTPNEAEFRSYNILTHLRDPDIIWSTELLPSAVFHHPLLQLALKLHALAQRSTLARGERASPNAFARFFKLVATEQVPYLFACLLSSHFPEIRRHALEALRHAYVKQHAGLPAQTLVKMLGADDEDEISAICEAFGIATNTSNEQGALLVELNKTAPLKPGSLGALKGHVSQRIVEAKRGQNSYADVIDGFVKGALPVAAAPPTPPIVQPKRAPQATFGTALAPAFGAPPSTTSAFEFGTGASPLTKRPQPESTPIPSLPPSRTATPVPQGAQPTLGGKLNPVASAFVPPKHSAFGIPPPTDLRPPTPFGLGAANTPAFQPAKTPSPFGAPPAQAPQAAKANPFGLSPAAATANPFGFGQAPSGPPPQPPAVVAPKAVVPAPLAPPPTFSFAPTPTPSNAPPIVPPPAPTAITAPATASLPPPATPVRPGPTPLSHTTTPVGPPPAKARDPARLARINALVRALSVDLLRTAIAPVLRRAVQDGLVVRWQLETAERKRLVAGHASELATRLLSHAALTHSVQAVGGALEDKRLLRGALRVWRESTVEKQVNRAEEKERRRKFQEVARDIGLGVDNSAQDDDVSSVLSFRRLNLGPNSVPSRGKKALDQAVSQRVQQASIKRQQLWTRGTFLDLLVDTVEPALARLQLGPPKPTWKTIVWTAEKRGAFASWLGCKFGLEEGSGGVSVEGRAARIEVGLVGGADKIEGVAVEQVGLVVFDATRPKGVELDAHWTTARAKLEAIVSSIEATSIYKPALLVLVCPEAGADAAFLQTTVARELDLSALGAKLTKSAVWVADLQRAEEQFELHVAQLLAKVDSRRDRLRRPLEDFLKPLVAVWRASLREASALSHRHGTSPINLLQTFVEALNFTVRETRTAAISAPAELVEVRAPVNVAPAEVRATLDALAEHALEAASQGQTRQANLDTKLGPALKKLRETLLAIEVERPAPAIIPSPMKKRKASMGGIEAIEEPRHKQKLSVVENGVIGRKEDRLSALSALMRDTRALLTDRSVVVESKLGSLIPPKIATPGAISGSAGSARMANVVQFYSALPKGPAAPKKVGFSPIARYRAKYFEGPDASGAPFIHAIGVLFLVGYTIDYNMHLKHHKNNHH